MYPDRILYGGPTRKKRPFDGSTGPAVVRPSLDKIAALPNNIEV
jgi:hypothetical protein